MLADLVASCSSGGSFPGHRGGWEILEAGSFLGKSSSMRPSIGFLSYLTPSHSFFFFFPLKVARVVSVVRV